MLVEHPAFDNATFTRPFAYPLFRSNTLPSGNIVAYQAPNVTEGQYAQSALHFQWEIAVADPFGGACLNRLFLGSIADAISQHRNAPVQVVDDTLQVSADYVNNKGVPLNTGVATVDTVSRTINGSHTIGHVALYVVPGDKASDVAYVCFDKDNCTPAYMAQYAIRSWYSLVGSLLQTYYRNMHF